MNNFIFSINQIADTWYSIIVPHSFQLLILFGILITVNFLFKKQSAIFGYGLWLIFIIKALIPMKIALFTNNEAVSKIVYINELVTKSLVVQPETKLQFSYESILFLIWILGILFLISRLIFTEFSFRKILNNSKEIMENKILFQTKNKIDIKKKVQLFSSENIPAPFTIGIFKPKIFIPYELLNSDEKQLKSILAHELAHIKRLDIIPIFMQTFVNIFYFFNPFIWLANRHINFYRERVCDEIALTNLGIEPSNYGKTLLTNLELLFVKKTKPIFANNLFQTKKIIIRRLESLFKNKEKIMLKLKKSQWIFLIIVAIFTLMLSCNKENTIKKESTKGKVEFVEYDVPPKPIGGADAIMKNVVYPQKAKDAKIEGKVIVQAFVNKDGIVTKTTIMKGIPNSGLNESAIDAVKMIKFTPAKKNKENVGVWIAVPIIFKLDGKTYGVIAEYKNASTPDISDDIEAIMDNLVYPESAKKNGIEGEIIVKIRINKEGKATEYSIVDQASIDNQEMKDAVIDAIKKTQFRSGVYNNKRLGGWIAVPINFKLKNDDDMEKNSKVKFVPYDVPPRPIGGRGTITKNIVYPPKAKESKIEGKVIVQAFVNKDGNISDWLIMEEPSIKNKELRESAIDALKKTKFTPAEQKGKTVGVWIAVPINFKLKNDDDMDKNSKVEFVPYDVPPRPIGGTDAIMKNVVYPKTAKKNKIEGKIVVQAFVNEKGVVDNCVIIKKMSHKNIELQNAAIDAVKKTKFKPATKNKKPAGVWMQFPINFKLKNDDDTKKNSRVKFIPYDTSPKPIGGADAIMKNIVYPEKARKAGIEGIVIIQAFINEKGIVTDCVVMQGIPNSGLNESAIDAIKKTKFTPGKQRDKIVGVWIAVPIDFKLKNGGKNETVITNPPEESFEEMKKIIIDNHSNGENEKYSVMIGISLQALIDKNGKIHNFYMDFDQKYEKFRSTVAHNKLKLNVSKKEILNTIIKSTINPKMENGNPIESWQEVFVFIKFYKSDEIE